VRAYPLHCSTWVSSHSGSCAETRVAAFTSPAQAKLMTLHFSKSHVPTKGALRSKLLRRPSLGRLLRLTASRTEDWTSLTGGTCVTRTGFIIRYKKYFVRFVFEEVNITTAILWDVKPCSLVGETRCPPKMEGNIGKYLSDNTASHPNNH
jgi:hypothetical protein